jgi:transposase-like protein
MAQVQQVNSAIAAVIVSAVVALSSWISLTEVIYLKSNNALSDMAVNGSGIRDPARVLKISPTTVIEELKKKNKILQAVNYSLVRQPEWRTITAAIDR